MILRVTAGFIFGMMVVYYTSLKKMRDKKSNKSY